MTEELFTKAGQFEKLSISDAEIYYMPSFALGDPDGVILHRLITETPWRQESVLVWAKKFPQPRLVAWYGDFGSDYTYSGITLHPEPWTPLLCDLKERVQNATNARYNSVLLNYYRDNRDSMGFHADDEPELGEEPVIASISLGEERTFILKHKTDKLAKIVRLRLASGSLLVMKGETQRYWKHGIAKETRGCGPRVNLTYRLIHIAHGTNPDLRSRSSEKRGAK